jgi:hypothetical protein
MTLEINARAPAVERDVIQSAARGSQGSWDQIVEAYAGSVWTVARRHNLTWQEAANVSQLTWLRLADRIADMSPEGIGAWLEHTAERESARAARVPLLDDHATPT